VLRHPMRRSLSLPSNSSIIIDIAKGNTTPLPAPNKNLVTRMNVKPPPKAGARLEKNIRNMAIISKVFFLTTFVNGPTKSATIIIVSWGADCSIFTMSELTSGNAAATAPNTGVRKVIAYSIVIIDSVVSTPGYF